MWMEDKAIISLVNWLTVIMVIRFVHVTDHPSCMQVFDCIYQIHYTYI